VGAHTSHLAATHRLRGPIPCTDCHLVPADVASAGHLDTDLPAEVFPADPAFMSLALADGALPVWDPATTSCSGVYCHGGGLWLSSDTASGLSRTPVWTLPGQAACGFCHGLPPLGTPGAHPSTLTIFDCVGCHSPTVDGFGNIVITGAPGAETSTHINGVVDVL
jgi:predicted CxxxxCH...CXXCH cytochrome family protein